MSTPIIQDPPTPSLDLLLDQLIKSIDRLTESRQQRVRAVNLTEATRMLGLKDPKVTRKMVEDKTLRGHHAGRRLLISVQSIDEWLGDHR